MTRGRGKRRIAILIDQKWRDLPGLIWLQLLLERRSDFDVRVFPVGSEQAYIPSYRPHVVLFNNLYEKHRLAFAHRLKRQGTRIVFFPTEGIPTLKPQLDQWAGRTSDWTDIDLYLTWNDVVRDRVLQLGRLPADRVKTLGVGRFDFYREPLRRASMERAAFHARFGLDPACRTILWATNFTLAGFHERNRELWKVIHRSNQWNLTFPDHGVEDLPRIDAETRGRTRQALLALRRAFPDANLAIKPHPNEDVPYWRGALAEFAALPGRGRVALLGGVYIWDALSSADVVVQRSCTTAVEGWFRGIPSIDVRLNPEDFYYSEEHASGSEQVQDIEGVVAMVRAYLYEGRTTPAALKEAQARFERKWCHAVDGRRTEAAAAEVGAVAEAAPDFVRWPEPHPRYGSQVLKATVKRVMGHQPHELLTWDYILRLRRKPQGADILGREDKYVMPADIAAWRSRLTPLVSCLNA